MVAVDLYLEDPDLATAYGFEIGGWDVSLVTDFSRVFSSARNELAAFFNEPLDGWVTSNALNMAFMVRVICVVEDYLMLSSLRTLGCSTRIWATLT